jgi:hypothetical protein
MGTVDRFGLIVTVFLPGGGKHIVPGDWCFFIVKRMNRMPKKPYLSAFLQLIPSGKFELLNQQLPFQSCKHPAVTDLSLLQYLSTRLSRCHLH